MNFKKSITLLFILLLSIMTMAAKQKSYTYIDGNNNDYTITTDSIFYSPITPAESSSGEYSGGDPKRRKISTEQSTKIQSLIQALLKDKANHISSRTMGCGTLLVGKKTIFIHSVSKLKAELEIELKGCIK